MSAYTKAARIVDCDRELSDLEHATACILLVSALAGCGNPPAATYEIHG